MNHCKTCNRPVQLPDAQLCNNCWEVEKRIDEYLESMKGRNLIARALVDAASKARVKRV